MCNRFKSRLQAAQIRDLMTMDLTVLPEAQAFTPHDDVRPSQETLALWRRDDGWVLGTAFWGFLKLPGMGKGLVINARSERIGSSPFWRDTRPCWLPVTGWIEYLVQGGRNLPQEVALPQGEPFLLAGVVGERDGMRRMAMQMQDAPARLAYLCDRLPIPIAFADLGRAGEPTQIIERMHVAG